MKTFTNIIAVSTVSLLLSAPVMAHNVTSASVGTVQAGSMAEQGNEQNITTNNNGSDLGRGVPSFGLPGLTTTLSETCMGSTSVGGSGPGFGFAVGSTWRDEACVRRLDARELRAMGRGGDPDTVALFALASKERMCDDGKIRAAFERVAKLTGNTHALCQATRDEAKAEAVAYIEPANVSRTADLGKTKDERVAITELGNGPDN